MSRRTTESQPTGPYFSLRNVFGDASSVSDPTSNALSQSAPDQRTASALPMAPSSTHGSAPPASSKVEKEGLSVSLCAPAHGGGGARLSRPLPSSAAGRRPTERVHRAPTNGLSAFGDHGARGNATSLTSDAAALKMNLSILQDDYATLLHTHEALRSEFEAVAQQKEAIEREAVGAQKTLAHEREALRSQVEKERMSTQEEVMRMQSQFQEEARRRDADLVSAGKALTEKEEALAKSEQTIASNDDSIRRLMQDMERLSKEADANRKALREAEAALEAERSRSSTEEARRSTLEEERSRTTRELSSRLEETSAKLRAAEKEAREKEERCARLASNLQAAQDSVAASAVELAAERAKRCADVEAAAKSVRSAKVGSSHDRVRAGMEAFLASVRSADGERAVHAVVPGGRRVDLGDAASFQFSSCYIGGQHECRLGSKERASQATMMPLETLHVSALTKDIALALQNEAAERRACRVACATR